MDAKFCWFFKLQHSDFFPVVSLTVALLSIRNWIILSREYPLRSRYKILALGLRKTGKKKAKEREGERKLMGVIMKQGADEAWSLYPCLTPILRDNNWRQVDLTDGDGCVCRLELTNFIYSQRKKAQKLRNLTQQPCAGWLPYLNKFLLHYKTIEMKCSDISTLMVK